MKYLLLLIVLTVGSARGQSRCARQMVFKHIGISDKPLFPLILTTQVQSHASSEAHGIVLSGEEFTQVERAIAPLPAGRGTKGSAAGYGTFHIAMTSPCSPQKAQVYSRAQAKALFQKVLLVAKGFRLTTQVAIEAPVSNWVKRL
jgi:hypothetical protein